MKTELDCLPCFVQQTIATVRRFGGDRATQERVVRVVLEILRDADMGRSPPVIAREIYAAINDCLHVVDPYASLKAASNEQVRRLLPQLRRVIDESADPFATTVKLALAGNIIDFGVSHNFDLEQTIERLVTGAPVRDEIAVLERRLRQAKRVLYLADNAGEIVLDRLLVEKLIAGGATVTVAVRGGPIINDVTVEDVAAAGLDRLVRVISPATTLPGICLERSGARFRRAFEEAELIVSKGQGNFETLESVAAGRPIFFIFIVKCRIVSQMTGLAEGSPVAAFDVVTP